MRLRNWFLLLWLGFLPATGILEGLFARITRWPGIETVLASAWVVVFGYIAIRLALWRCPHCRNRFVGQEWYGPDLAAWECGHCGLERTSFRKMGGR